MIAFDSKTGKLPAGIHSLNWAEVVKLCGFNAHRKRQLEGLKRAIFELRNAGCKTIYLDGSFVTDKPEPGDYDGAYDASAINGNILQKNAPELLNFDNSRKAMKDRFEGELFPSDWDAGDGVPFLEFFQHDRDGLPKGIIKIDTRSVK